MKIKNVNDVSIDVNLDQIKKIRKEQKQKEKELKKSVENIVKILKPQLSYLTKIPFDKSVRDEVLKAVQVLLSESAPHIRYIRSFQPNKSFEETVGLGFDFKSDVEKLCKRMNPLLAKVGLRAKGNYTAYSWQKAINIYKIKVTRITNQKEKSGKKQH